MLSHCPGLPVVPERGLINDTQAMHEWRSSKLTLIDTQFLWVKQALYKVTECLLKSMEM